MVSLTHRRQVVGRPPVARGLVARPPGGAAAGFTLIELTVVLTIIVIAYLALQPVFTGAIRSARRRATLRRVVGLLTQARSEAVGRGRLVRVVCDAGEGVLWAEVQVDPAVDRSEFAPLRVVGSARVALPERFALTGLLVAGMDMTKERTAEIYFYPDGRTDGAELSLSDDEGREVTVKVAPTTGKVTLSA
jgi:prepilin-type N-terminal cleavage/methylation domain-containing protein